MAKKAPQKTTYCELVRNPDRYDGQEVWVYASYWYGFEGQDLLCVECREAGNTWLELDEHYFPKVKLALKKLPKDAGIVNGEFTGIFVGTRGNYGPGGYRFKFILTGVNHLEVVFKGLPHSGVDFMKKMCGGKDDRRSSY